MERLRQAELWTARLRIAAVVLGAVEVGLLDHPYPRHYETAAWAVTFFFALGAFFLLVGCSTIRTRRGLKRLGVAALAFDTAVAYAYMTVFAFEPGVVSWGLVYLPVIEAAVRYGLAGGLVTSALSVPLLAAVEWWRSSRFLPGGFDGDLLLLPAALAFFTGASQFEQPAAAIAAAAVVVTIPVVILVLLFQRRIVAGLTAGAVKG
jgi:hypothetical protein